MKRVRHAMLYPVVHALFYAASLLPMGLLYKFAGLLYLFACHVFAYRKSVVIQNLSRSFPGKKYDEIAAIARDFYRFSCDSFVEVIKSLGITARRQREKIEVVGSEIIEKHLGEGRHVIASMGHCGNWELLNALPLFLTASVNTVYKPLSSGVLDRLFLEIRSRFGMNMIPRNAIARHLISNRGTPSVYLFLADQCPRVVSGTSRFRFLHQETSVFPGVEKLARATGSAVVYLHVVRISRGKYRFTCKEICGDPARAMPSEITATYLRLLEQNIEESPAGWLWSHKRWKR
ncbi:MAG: lysophospholipid acyltransferase family protein [Odoribacteraceae bacterium]|jgi:KDO2-lipid IV(A) lauroyltransferase|nr:lysophospholipid acyltransferase family protein [Odoribacteraceae bacterium]